MKLIWKNTESCEGNHFDIIYTSMLLTQLELNSTENSPGILLDEVLRTLKTGASYLFHESFASFLENFHDSHQDLIQRISNQELIKLNN